MTFIAEKPPENFPTKWIAKQVLINDQTAATVTKAVDRGPFSVGATHSTSVTNAAAQD